MISICRYIYHIYIQQLAAIQIPLEIKHSMEVLITTSTSTYYLAYTACLLPGNTKGSALIQIRTRTLVLVVVLALVLVLVLVLEGQQCS